MTLMEEKLISRGGIMFRLNWIILIYFIFITVSFAEETININENNLLKEDPQAVKNILMNPINSTNTQKNQNTATQEASKVNGSLLIDNHINQREQSKWAQQSTAHSSKPKEVSMFPNSVGNQDDNNQQNTGTIVQTTPIKMGKRLIRDMPVSATYHMNARNYISESGVNAIVSPIKITGFVPEPGSVTFQWINNNHGIAFQIKDDRKTLQAIVTFDSQKNPVSLFFDVTNVAGRVISLPSSLTGTTPLSKDPMFSNQNTDSYDKYITQLMNDIVDGKSLGQAWQYQESATAQNPYNEIAVKRYQHWFNRIYSIKNFELCSQSNETVSLNEKTFASTDTLAVTLTKHKLHPRECSRLVVMSKNQIDDSEITDLYTPSREQ